MMRLSALGLIAATLALGGCAASTKTGSVEGRVTFDSKPLANAIVTFTTASGESFMAQADDQGQYRVDGVPVGPVKIGVDVPPDDPSAAGQAAKVSGQDPDARAKADASKKTKPKGVKIPASYADPLKSELSHSVTEGLSTCDIKLVK